MRIGHGYDVHQFADGRKCIIGGVEIPYEKGLLGHSDADVLLHAVSDALLGAAALGDIALREAAPCPGRREPPPPPPPPGGGETRGRAGAVARAQRGPHHAPAGPGSRRRRAAVLSSRPPASGPAGRDGPAAWPPAPGPERGECAGMARVGLGQRLPPGRVDHRPSARPVPHPHFPPPTWKGKCKIQSPTKAWGRGWGGAAGGVERGERPGGRSLSFRGPN